MKPPDFDPNRPYNRDAINKEQKKRAYLMDLEALKKGREYDGLPEIGEADLKKDLKINPQLKLYYDVYTGEILRGRDRYDFEHILSAHFLHSILKATHTDEEIAIITNASKNVGVTRRDLNNHKKKHNLKDYILDHSEKVQRYKINKNIAKRALIEAEDSASLLSGIDIPRSYGNVRDAKLHYNPDRKISQQSAAALSNSSNVFYSNKFLKSNLSLNLQILTKIPYKIISLSLALILVIVLFLWIMDVIPFNSNINNTALVPQKEKIENEYKNEPEKDLAKTNLSFAKPLDDLTKSITDISEFKSILENENTIPVIGSMFEYNSSAISNNGIKILDGFAIEYSKLEVQYKVLIEGFTCTVGSKESNEKLAGKRADNLKTELIRLGIPENVIILKPIGMQNFVSTNNENKDLVLNRRSNVTILSIE